MSSSIVSILASIPWFGWIAIVAIIGGVATQIVAMQHSHAERMEMLRQGIIPSEKPEAEKEV